MERLISKERMYRKIKYQIQRIKMLMKKIIQNKINSKIHVLEN